MMSSLRISDSKAPELVEIVSDGDLQLRIYTTKDVGDNNFRAAKDGETTKGVLTTIIKVSRQVMIDHSDYFKMMLTNPSFSESRQNTIDIEHDHPISAELWFRVYHGTGIPEPLHKIPADDICHVIEYGRYLQSKPYLEANYSKLKPWFNKYLDLFLSRKPDIEEIRKLLYPCHLFDSAKGFSMLTRKLAYECAEHVTEYRCEYREQHLDGNVIGALNGARGSLRTTLIKGLFDPAGQLLKSTCKCAKESYFQYGHKKPVLDIIKSLHAFECSIPSNACQSCRSKLSKTAINELKNNTLQAFHGLCLYRMEITKTGDVHADYWLHDIQKSWDEDCCINHRQMTWYFSFMGRKTDMQKHKKSKRDHYERNL